MIIVKYINEIVIIKEVLNDDSVSGYIDVYGEILEVLFFRWIVISN